MMQLVYFMTLPSYVDRRALSATRKKPPFPMHSIYIHSNIFYKSNCNDIVLIQDFFKVLYTTSMVQWSKHWLANMMLRVQVTLEFWKDLVYLGLGYFSLIHVFINPETPPLPSCRNLKSKKQKVGSTIR